MATPCGRAVPPLERALFEEPYRFDFFQAVRLLARLDPDRASVGAGGAPRREWARFDARLSLAFPPSSVHALEPAGAEGEPPAMTVAFMGLVGPSGVLPRVYTELVMERRRAGDRTPAAFLGIFEHRAVSLFYRAWEKNHFAVARERGGPDPLTDCVFDVIGLGRGPLRNRHEFPDDAILFYAGFFAKRHRPAVVLESLLRDYFEVPVTVQQFAGCWLRLAPGDRSKVGASGAHNGLGMSTVLGQKVWDEQGMIRVRIGPLTFREFLAHQPDGPAALPLAQMVRHFVDSELDVQIQLILRAEEVPACRLTPAPGAGARLGRYAWLKSKDFDHDADDAVFVARA
jgi:type VI secretion system protein ImpH